MHKRAKSKTSGEIERRLLLGAARAGKSGRLVERLQAEAAESGEETIITCDPAGELTGRYGVRKSSRPVGESGTDPGVETWTYLASGSDDRIADWMFGPAPHSSSEKFFRKAGAFMLRQILGQEAARIVPLDFSGGDENEGVLQKRDEDSPGKSAAAFPPTNRKTARRCWRT